MANELIKVEPKKLTIERPDVDSGRRIREKLSIRSVCKSGKVVAFKLQTNASKRFNVQPAQGFLRSGEEKQVLIQLKQGAGWADSDKFLIRAVETDSDSIPIHQVWEDSNQQVVQKVVLRCHYVSSNEISAEADSTRDAIEGKGRAPETPWSSNTPVMSPTTSPTSLSTRQLEMLVKNLSNKPEDRLSNEELEELVQLRQAVGPKVWTQLQEQARIALESVNSALQPPANSTIPIHSPPPPPAPSRTSAQMGSAAAFTTFATMSLTELLTKGVALLREDRMQESVEAFQAAMKKSQPGRVERAQVLVGLGSAYEAAGILDLALDCYLQALKIYDRLNDRACKDSVANAIAHVYADMRDHTMAAAWFDFQLDLIGSEPSQGAHRSNTLANRDHQMKLGHVTPALLAAGRGRVASLLSSRQHSNSSSSSSSSIGSFGALKGVTPHLPSATTKTVETLWEPAASFSNGRAYTSSTLPNTTAITPQDALEENPTLRPPKKSFSVVSNGNPHYLAPTTASKASRFSGPAKQEPDPADDGSVSERPSVAPNPVVVEKRNRAAAALHVRRALEARRKKDQSRGIKPPSVRKHQQQQQQNRNGNSPEETAFPQENGTGQEEDDLVIILKVFSHIDHHTYSIALPGPLSTAEALSVRDMREKVSFVTGVELHDFELVVENTPLSDSWIGQDIGLDQNTEVELRLLPGVRPSKYSQLSPSNRLSSADNTSIIDHDDGAGDTRERPSTGPGTNGIPTPPKRKPPPPAPSPGEEEPFSAISVETPEGGLSLDGEESPSTTMQYDADDVTINELCSSLQATLKEQKRATDYADEIYTKALAILDAEDEPSATQQGEGGDYRDLGEYTASLVEKVIKLEGDLEKSDREKAALREELAIVKEKMVELHESHKRGTWANATLQSSVQSLRKDHEALAAEIRAMLANYTELLRQNARLFPTGEATMPCLVVEAKTEADEPMQICFVASEECTSEDKDDETACTVVVQQVQQDLPSDTWLFPYAFGADYLIPRSGGVDSHAAGKLFQDIKDNFADGSNKTTYFVNLGEARLFPLPGKASTSFLVPLVTTLFETMPGDKTSKVRAVAIPVNDVGGSNQKGIVDLLDPKREREDPKPVVVRLDDQHDVRIQNAVAVKFTALDDFVRLNEVLTTRVKASTPSHFLFSLENLASGNRLVLLQVHGVPSDQSNLLGQIFSGIASAQVSQSFIFVSQLDSHDSTGILNALSCNFPSFVSSDN